MTIQQAYKEGIICIVVVVIIIIVIIVIVVLVIKFKRRPQYLQYFVHLADKAFSCDKGEIILEWSKDVFAWLRR